MAEMTAEQKAQAERDAASKNVEKVGDTSHQKKYDGGPIPRVPKK